MENKTEIVGIVLLTFGVLTASSKLLTAIAEKTANQTDNKIAKGFAKVLGLASQMIDLFTAGSTSKKN